ncbi:Tryptophan--tRNA ligase, mitochondrial, partial [Ascosphaera atra]
MSKSHPDPMSRILLTDCDEDIKLKLRKALTDSEPNITFDRENRPGVSNLIEILAHIEGVSPQDIAAEFHDTNLGVFKAHVAER